MSGHEPHVAPATWKVTTLLPGATLSGEFAKSEHPATNAIVNENAKATSGFMIEFLC